MRGTPVLAASLAALLLGSAARGETGVGSWLAQDGASGDWGGLRRRAEAAGLAVEGGYQTDLLRNLGGEAQGFAYAGTMEISLDFDLGKIAGLEGTSFFIAAYWASGDDLSATEIGNRIGVAQAFNGRTVGLAQMYLEQTLFEGRLAVALGRLSAGNDFATSDLYASYVSTGVNENPFAMAANLPSLTADPVAQWGVRAILRPSAQIRLAAGAYNTDPDVFKDGRHGVDFTLDPQDGVLAIAEAGYAWNQTASAAGLPGSVTLGGYYDSSDFDPVAEAGDGQDGNHGFYLLLDQMLYREGGSRQGVTPWVALTLAPDQQINPIPFSAAGGLVYRGLPPGRDDDLSALAVYHGRFSDELEGQNAETVIEANHRFQLTPWLYMTPDFQYVIRPDGRSDIDDAVVFGGEIGIAF
ncbi:MAG TPA: carbohydrate porin [Geminicoccaceae bacterium]|nr:carbohydrate porin [Geminicoccaceae bacterium]